jgi:hypothetical protein
MIRAMLATFALVTSGMSAATTVRLPDCASPRDDAVGLVQIRYRVSEDCEPSEVRFQSPAPPRSLQDAALCIVRWVQPDGVTRGEPISEREYRRLREIERKNHAERHHSRSIRVTLGGGAQTLLTCHFDPQWKRIRSTMTVTRPDGATESVDFTDFDSLPEQFEEFEFKRTDD